jgi:hypothetical protein
MPKAAANPITATKTKILGFTELYHFLDILNVEIVIIILKSKIIVQYFQAVQQGKQRASKSQMKMFEVAGFGMLTLTTKKIDGKFHPVGEEDFVAVINSPEGYVTILVDIDGFTKAQSKSLDKNAALLIYKKLRDSGIPEYPKNEIQIWSEKRPTIQNEISE